MSCPLTPARDDNPLKFLECVCVNMMARRESVCQTKKERGENRRAKISSHDPRGMFE